MEDIKLEISQKKTCAQINIVLDQYERAIKQKFESNEVLLIEQLQQKTIKLKSMILFYKKQTSTENIEKLIDQKKHQKQAQRIQLELNWRNLTDEYKNLHQQQKKIHQQNKQITFDIQNFERKISQLRQATQYIATKIQKMKKQVQGQSFVTEFKSNNKPTQKSNLRTEEFLKFSRQFNDSNKLRFKFLDKRKFLKLDKQNNRKKNSNLIQNKSHNFQSLQQKNSQHILQHEKQTKKLLLNNFYKFEHDMKVLKQNQPKVEGKKWKQLMYYLSKPEVKDKIFDLLSSQNLRIL